MDSSGQCTGVSVIRYASELDALGAVRTELKRRLQASPLGADEAALDGLLLATVEAVVNVIEHAHGQDGRPARVELHAAGEGVEVYIYDSGSSANRSEAVPAVPDPLSEGGRGLFLIDALTDESVYEAAPGGENVLRLLKRVTRQPS